MSSPEQIILHAAAEWWYYNKRDIKTWLRKFFNLRKSGYIIFDKNNVMLEMGTSMKLNIKSQSHSEKIDWSSSSTDIVSVNKNGVCCAKSIGEVAITAFLHDSDYYESAETRCYMKVIGEKPISIAILGMPAAGKTTLLRFLQGEPERDEIFVTPDEGADYDAYTYKKDDGTRVKIAKGRDISGIEYIQKEYPPLIKKSDIILFLFSLEKYNDDPKEKEEIQSRLDFLYAHLGGKRLAVFMTYKERFGENDAIRTNKSKKAYRSYKQEISTKAYAKILDYPHHIISLKYGEDKSELKKIIDNLL